MKFFRLSSVSLCLCVGIITSGCSTMSPTYSRPAAPTPTVWPTGPAYQTTLADPKQKPVADIPWQEFFVATRTFGN